MTGIPSRGDLREGTLTSGSKSVTLGVFMVIGNQPISQHIIGNRARMRRLKFISRHFLVVRTGKERGVGDFDTQNIIPPNFAGVLDNCGG